MFDVSWQEGPGETIAQRRQRKARDEVKSTKGSRRSSMQSSSGSSMNSSQTPGPPRPAMFGMFGNMKKPSSLKAQSHPQPNTVKEANTRNSRDSSSSEASESAFEHVVGSKQSVAETAESSPGSNGESTFSSWLGGKSIGTDPSFESMCSEIHEVQPLSPKSFITRTTEVTISSNEEIKLAGKMTNCHISADCLRIDELDLDLELDLNPKSPVRQKIPLQAPPVLLNRPRMKGGRRRIPSASSTKPTPKESWKPPEEWECPSDESDAISQITKASSRSNCSRVSKSEASQMARHIRRMEAASPKIMLERLREEWTNVADGTIYKELEFEKQLWMMMGLKRLAERAGGSGGREDGFGLPVNAVGASGVVKVLSLYENQACASFIASFTPAVEIHHLSTFSYSPSSIPTIRPLTVPTPLTTLPYAPNIFSSISCSSIPSILPAQSIPSLLRECHRTIVRSGTLHLTIMDPCPVACTTGPKLRAWLDEHLMLNLETQFRCVNPGRLIPIWLYDAGFSCTSLHAKVYKLRFWALGVGEAGFGEEGIPKDKGDAAVARELGQLTATVGRMLWREMWGNFVKGSKWWWEDESVVEECARLGTRWECSILEAVKRSRED